MISCFGKILLVATSLAPICGAFAVGRINDVGAGWYLDLYFWSWAGAGCGLLFVTFLFLTWCQRHLKHTSIESKQIKPTDKDVLAFLLAYLLPLLGKDAFAIDKPIVAIYVLALVFLTVYHSSSFHFNPMLAMCGYHFYDIETAAGYSAVLISKESHTTQSNRLVIVRITPFLLLEVSEKYLAAT